MFIRFELISENQKQTNNQTQMSRSEYSLSLFFDSGQSGVFVSFTLTIRASLFDQKSGLRFSASDGWSVTGRRFHTVRFGGHRLRYHSRFYQKSVDGVGGGGNWRFFICYYLRFCFYKRSSILKLDSVVAVKKKKKKYVDTLLRTIYVCLVCVGKPIEYTTALSDGP